MSAPEISYEGSTVKIRCKSMELAKTLAMTLRDIISNPELCIEQALMIVNAMTTDELSFWQV